MTIEEIKAANRRAGYHFFSSNTMRSFGSRVSDKVYQGPGGIFIVTSEKTRYSNEPREYMARQFHPETGAVSNAMDGWGSKHRAHARAKFLAENGVDK
jgi:hypothetical protein